MKYIKIFEDYNKDGILIIVDVQRSFKSFFTDNYLSELSWAYYWCVGAKKCRGQEESTTGAVDLYIACFHQWNLPISWI